MKDDSMTTRFSVLTRAILCLTLFIGSSSAIADVLDMPPKDAGPPNSEAGVLRPVYGDSMEKVKGQFGEPKESQGPVGNPPISRWIYNKFTVVFEGDTVIHAYVN